MDIVDRVTKIEASLVRLEAKFETGLAKQDSQFAQLAAKFDSGFSDVRAGVAHTENSFIKWAVGLALAIVGVMFGIARFADGRALQPAAQQALAPVVIQVPPSMPPMASPSPPQPPSSTAIKPKH